MRFLPALGIALALHSSFATAEPPAFDIQLDTISSGFDKKSCWVHPRAGAIPGTTPIVVLTMQKAMLSGSDVFGALNEMRTDDLGRTWSGPVEHAAALGRRDEPGGIVVAACDNETWVTDAEWMQTNPPNYADYTACMKYGSNNAVFVARIQWKKPNKSWNQH